MLGRSLSERAARASVEALRAGRLDAAQAELREADDGGESCEHGDDKSDDEHGDLLVAMTMICADGFRPALIGINPCRGKLRGILAFKAGGARKRARLGFQDPIQEQEANPR